MQCVQAVTGPLSPFLPLASDLLGIQTCESKVPGKAGLFSDLWLAAGLSCHLLPAVLSP